MSVSESIVLPAQPSSGKVVDQGLAGSGYWSPHSETQIRIILAGDASGGTASMTFQWDPRWTSMLQWVSFGASGISADVVATISYRITANLGCGGTVTAVAPPTTGFNAQAVWCPPPQLASVPTIGGTQPNLRIVCDNTDGDTFQLDASLLNFAKDVRNIVPYSSLVSSLARSSSNS